jgi:YVTN family beta-propeller protein
MSSIRVKIFCCLLLGSLFACRSDKPEDEPEPSITITPNSGVIIVNEGNYTQGNATVGYYNRSTGSFIEDLFEPINKRPLGDVFQSMCIFNRKAYLVVNNSGKIEVVNPESFVSIATINGLVSPRYFLPVSNGKAYVTNYKTNQVTVIDLNTLSGIGTIPCGYGNLNEEMMLSYGKAYVTTPASNKVYVINTRTDVLEDSIEVCRGGGDIEEDANGKLWVLCSGKESANELAGLYRIDPVSNKVEWSARFTDKAEHPWRLTSNGDHTRLYYLSKEGVYAMAINATSLPASAIISKGNRNFYGLGVDPKDETVYIGDDAGFVAQGTVYRYQGNGTFINSFKTGIGPNGFYFQ